MTSLKYAYYGILFMIVCAAIAPYGIAYFNTESLQNQQKINEISQEQLQLAESAVHLLSALEVTKDNAAYLAVLPVLNARFFQLKKNNHILSTINPNYAINSIAPISNDILKLRNQKNKIRDIKPSLNKLIQDLMDAKNKHLVQHIRNSKWTTNLNLTFLAALLCLLGIQGIVFFYPAYQELQKNVRKVKKTRKDLNYATTHDPITELLNRKEAERTLDWSIASAKEKDGLVGLFHIDIDEFSVINEKLGHAAGDNLLFLVSQRLKEIFRKTDTLARISADEFMIIIPNLDCEETLVNLAQKLCDTLEKPLQLIGNHQTTTSCCIGMACYPEDSRNPQELLVAANMALRKAKENGKGHIIRFNASMRSDFNRKMAICDRIDSALANREFEVFYHPQIHMQSGAITGIEALVRWRDPEIGLRSPGNFIDIIEASGYMGKLGAYILDQAISDATSWYNEGINFGRIALNMSSVQLNDIDLVDQLLNSLMKYRLPTRFLSIEILENVVIAGQEHRFKQLIDELNDLDIHVELDDFGTGHASLYNLKQFSINRIKLDCNFISEIETNEKQRSIVEGLVKIINNIGLEIIAEGVETTEQAILLKDWGCLHAQGFLYTKPLPYEEMTKYLKQADYTRKLTKLTAPHQPNQAASSA